MPKNKTKLNRFLSWVGLTMLRTIILILGYTLEIIMTSSEFMLWVVFRIGKPIGINIPYFDEMERSEEGTDFSQKYTKDQIEQLSDQIDPDAKIKDIQDHFGISYRQARKIKHAAKSTTPLSINHYSWEDKVV